MGTPVPPSLVEAFAINGDRNSIPIPSQIGVSPELASFNDGFPPATRTPRTQGGIPPRGLDMNGILYMISAHTAWGAAGGQPTFNADVVVTPGGYNVGAVLQSAITPTLFFVCLTANNVNDPDATAAPANGWLPFNVASAPTGTQAANIAAGSQTFAVESSAGFVDLTPNAGNTTVTNFTGGAVGQIIVVTNLHATNDLTIQSNANIRMSGDLTLLQNNSISLRRRTASQWVAMS